MALIRFRPYPRAFDPFQIHRFFDESVERVWIPAIDVVETKDDLVVSAELPGMNESDIQLSITDDTLTIKGERQWTGEAREGTQYRGERWFGKFERVLTLPLPVEPGQAKATYRDGVLTVKLPKAAESKTREIKIEAA